MRSLAFRLVVAAAFLGLVGLGMATAGDSFVGKAPPEIKAEGYLNAEKAPTLADLKGKPVVVEFWATWCPPCRRSIPHLIELHDKYKKDGLVIVGLSDESKDKVEPFAKQMNMSYIVGFGSKSFQEYGVNAIPAAFVVSPEGKVLWQGNPLDTENFENAIKDALAKKAL